MIAIFLPADPIHIGVRCATCTDPAGHSPGKPAGNPGGRALPKSANAECHRLPYKNWLQLPLLLACGPVHRRPFSACSACTARDLRGVQTRPSCHSARNKVSSARVPQGSFAAASLTKTLREQRLKASKCAPKFGFPRRCLNANHAGFRRLQAVRQDSIKCSRDTSRARRQSSSAKRMYRTLGLAAKIALAAGTKFRNSAHPTTVHALGCSSRRSRRARSTPCSRRTYCGGTPMLANESLAAVNRPSIFSLRKGHRMNRRNEAPSACSEALDTRRAAACRRALHARRQRSAPRV